MLLLSNFTNAPNQTAEIVLPDSSTCNLSLTFNSLINSWFFYFNYTKLNVNYFGQRLINNPNILYPFSNILNFGLLCEVIDGGEPWFLNDFITQRVNLYILDSTEVQTINAFLQKT